jgi:transcriptional regulator with XRE-family HTH domain
MTNLSPAQALRAKVIGALIRKARIEKGIELSDCAEALGLSTHTLEAFELGEKSISLPELEAISYHLEVPIERLRSSEMTSPELDQDKQTIDIERLIPLRQRMIGARLRQARLENQFSLEALSAQFNIEPAVLEAYELGQEPIPVPVLESLSNALNRSIREFQDQHGPVGTWDTRQRAIKGFLELPPDMQTFVSKPINQPYLELAQRLSKMPVDRLRAVAEGLLEITY